MYAGDKTVQIRVRISPEQVSRLDTQAALAGVNRSEYLRTALVEQVSRDESIREAREST